MQLNKKSVMLGYIHGGQIWAPFMESVIRFLQHDQHERQVFYKLSAASGLYLHVNRNAVVENFLRETQAEVLVFLDTDILFPPEHIYGLLDTVDPDNAPIVSGLYFGYVANTRGLLPVWFDAYDEAHHKFNVCREIKPGVQPLGAIGMGFCAIHRRALEKVGAICPQGWFDHLVTWETNGSAVPQKHNFGEDMAFCIRAWQAGCPIIGNADLVVEHIKWRVENFESFLKHWKIEVNDPAHEITVADAESVHGTQA